VNFDRKENGKCSLRSTEYEKERALDRLGEQHELNRLPPEKKESGLPLLNHLVLSVVFCVRPQLRVWQVACLMYSMMGLQKWLRKGTCPPTAQSLKTKMESAACTYWAKPDVLAFGPRAVGLFCQVSGMSKVTQQLRAYFRKDSEVFHFISCIWQPHFLQWSLSHMLDTSFSLFLVWQTIWELWLKWWNRNFWEIEWFMETTGLIHFPRVHMVDCVICIYPVVKCAFSCMYFKVIFPKQLGEKELFDKWNSLSALLSSQ